MSPVALRRAGIAVLMSAGAWALATRLGGTGHAIAVTAACLCAVVSLIVSARGLAAKVPGSGVVLMASIAIASVGAYLALAHETMAFTPAGLDVVASLTLGWLAVAVVFAVVLQSDGATTVRIQRGVRTLLTFALTCIALVALVDATRRADWQRSFASRTPKQPSEATLALLREGVCDGGSVVVYALFERGSTAYVEIADYLAAIRAQGIAVEVTDVAADPSLAKQLKATKNGAIAISCGARSELLNLGSTRQDITRKLKRLDEDVARTVAKAMRPAQVVYTLAGHGELGSEAVPSASSRPQTKLVKRILDAKNVTTKRLALDSGLAAGIPNDAAMVIVAAPTHPLLPAEVTALADSAGRGGAVLLLMDGDTDAETRTSLQPLWQLWGSAPTEGRVLDADSHVNETGTAVDQRFIYATSFGSHPITKGVAALKAKAMLLKDARAWRTLPGGDGDAPGGQNHLKSSVIVRSRPTAFVDVNGDDVRGEDEPNEIVEFARAIETPAGARVLLVGDGDVFGDALLQYEANQRFAIDALMWLLRDDAVVGITGTFDVDPPIQHADDDDTLWLLGTVLLVPAAVMCVGAVVLRRKRRPARRDVDIVDTTSGVP